MVSFMRETFYSRFNDSTHVSEIPLPATPSKQVIIAEPKESMIEAFHHVKNSFN